MYRRSPRSARRPEPPERQVLQLGRYAVFGWMATIVGCPVAFNAVAATDTSVWIIPKRAIDGLTLNSSEFQQLLHLLLQSKQITDYLKNEHGVSQQAATDWVADASIILIQRGVVPAALQVSRNSEQFMRDIEQIRHFPLLHGLPAEEQELLCQHLVYKSYRKGESFFLQRSASDRMFFLYGGEVNLLDPDKPLQKTLVLRPLDACAGLATAAVACRSTTAVAVSDCRVRELRRRDFERLLRKAPVFRRYFQGFVKFDEAAAYLEQKQQFSADQASRWSRVALGSMDSRRQPIFRCKSKKTRVHHSLSDLV